MANLYGFMALTAPGDKIIVPPAEIGGHITHHNLGCAGGTHGLEIVYGPVDAAAYTYDLDQLRDQARRERPKLITVGGSLNLFPHPVGAIRAIATRWAPWCCLTPPSIRSDRRKTMGQSARRGGPI